MLNTDITDFFARASAYDTDECLLWPFGRDKDGYGTTTRLGYTRATHVVLHMAGQTRPKDAQTIHSCDNPPCVNVRHLSWGSVQTNALDREIKGRRPNGFNPSASRRRCVGCGKVSNAGGMGTHLKNAIRKGCVRWVEC